jgi:hypothetical protein
MEIFLCLCKCVFSVEIFLCLCKCISLWKYFSVYENLSMCVLCGNISLSMQIHFSVEIFLCLCRMCVLCGNISLSMQMCFSVEIFLCLCRMRVLCGNVSLSMQMCVLCGIIPIQYCAFGLHLFSVVAVLMHTCRRELSPAHLVCPRRHNV